jgi:hypothetical protein
VVSVGAIGDAIFEPHFSANSTRVAVDKRTKFKMAKWSSRSVKVEELSYKYLNTENNYTDTHQLQNMFKNSVA